MLHTRLAKEFQHEVVWLAVTSGGSRRDAAQDLDIDPALLCSGLCARLMCRSPSCQGPG
jgi:hypothetical protein